jgi:AAA+ superfamily predicted ATPase
MQKVVLSEISLIHGSIDSPQGFEINRNKIRSDILASFITQKRITNNEKSYSYRDYEVPYSQPLTWLKDYLRDHVKVEYGFTLVQKSEHGNVMYPNEKSFTRHQVDPVDLRNSPDYTLIYGVDVADNSCELIIEYDDNRRKNRTWHVPIKDNYFYMFPATNKYCITENRSNKLNTILTINYEYI